MKKPSDKQDYDIIVDEIAAVMTGRSDVALLDSRAAATSTTLFPDDDGRARSPMSFVIDRRGLIVQQNTQAARMLGLCIGDPVATVTDSPQTARDFLSSRAMTSDPLPLSVLTLDGDLVLFLSTTCTQHDHIILQEVRRGLNDDVQDRLAQTMGLSPGESQVYFRLLEGQPIKDIATSLNKTEGTIRQQVKAVLSKAGVSSQVQLVSIAYALSLAVDRTTKPPVTINHTLASAVLQAGPKGDVPYARFGLAGGMPVLLLHGALFGVSALPELHVAAQSLGLDIIVPIRPGYGDCPLPDEADAVDLTVRHACAVLDHCDLRRVVVVAHDVGTRFAVRLARDHPDRVVALVAAPTTPPMQGWHQTSDMPLRHRANAWASQNFPGLMDRLVLLGLSQVAQKGGATIPQLVFAGCDFDQAVMGKDEHRPVLKELTALVMRQQGKGFCSDMHITNDDWSGELPCLAMPIIALHGEHSLTVSRKAVEKLTQSVPNGHFRLVADAGHSLPLSHPALVLRYAFAAGMRAGLAGLDHGVF